MHQAQTTPQRSVAQLVEQLGRRASSEAFSGGLNPAQWSALRYFERANRFSRTVSAFARYHGTTRGTASQTVRALVGKGLLSRSATEHDQRSFRLDLTDRARRRLASDPLASFVSAAGTLPDAQCAMLAQALRKMLEHVQGAPAFGMCTSCRHLREVDGARGTACTHRCRFKDAPLADEELGRICIDYESRGEH